MIELNQSISNVLREIQERRKLEDLAIMIFNEFSEIEVTTSTTKTFSLKVEQFFKFSTEWRIFCATKQGHPAMIIEVKEKMIAKMDSLMNVVLQYANECVRGYEFYIVTSYLKEGFRTNEFVWGNEYEFELAVRKTEESAI